MENINWICKSITVNNNIVWSCHPKIKEHFEATTNTVQLFSAANYGGNSSSFDIGRYTSTQLDKIGPKALQSLKVPSGLVALLYQNADFTGYGKAITADTPDLSKITDSKNTGFNWSNQMQSLIVQPHVALPTSISDSMPKISLVASDPNSFITAVSGAKLTRIEDSYYLYVDPNNPDNLFWYSAGDLQIIPPFSINNISGMQLWLDGKDPLNNGNPPADGTSIDMWKDKSGKKNDLKARKPATYATSSNSLNFNRSFYNSINTLTYPIDVYVIVKLNDTTGPYDICGLDVNNGDDFNSLTFGELRRGHWQNGSSGFSRSHNAIASSNETSTNFLLMQWSIDEKNFYIKRNGTQIMSSNSYTWNQNPHYFQLGSRHYNDHGNTLVGSISEVLAFDSQLNTTQSQIIEGYLAWKWGLQANLPDNHPFKSAAPSGSTAFPKVPKFFLTNIEKSKPRTQVNFVSMSSDGKNIIAQGENLPTVLSTDYGKTWKRIHNPNFDDWHYQGPILISDQGQILIHTVSKGSFFSSDLGANWKEVCEKSDHLRPSACSKDGKIWYVCYHPHELWKSDDSGNSFKKFPRIPGNGGITCVSCTDDGNTVYISTYGGSDGTLYKSTNGANNWTKINNLRGGDAWNRVFCSGDGTIVLGVHMSPLGVISNDSGNTWTDINLPGYRPSPFTAVILSKDGSTIVVGCYEPMTLIKSTNQGKTWTQLPKTGLEAKGYYFNLAISKDGSSLAAATTGSDIGSLAIMN